MSIPVIVNYVNDIISCESLLLIYLCPSSQTQTDGGECSRLKHGHTSKYNESKYIILRLLASNSSFPNHTNIMTSGGNKKGVVLTSWTKAVPS